MSSYGGRLRDELESTGHGIIHAVPMALTVASCFVCLGLLLALVAAIDGDEIKWPLWVVLIVFGPVAFLLLMPWTTAVY